MIKRFSTLSVKPFAHAQFADFRSDTVTRPSKAMKQAMITASIGDDDRNDCPTTKQFEQEVADLLGKEAALFVPTGTMANLVSLLTMAKTAGESIIVGDKCHFLHYEGGSMGSMGSVLPRVLPTL